MKTIKKSSLTIIFFWVLVGCQGSSNHPFNLSITPGVTPFMLTSTQAPIHETPTFIMPTSTARLEITPTTMPTLNFQDAQSFLLNLLETNGGCKLPCWWGWIIPGKSKWIDVENFLQTFADSVNLWEKKGDLVLYSIVFKVPEEIRVEKKLIVAIDVRDGIVEEIFLGQPYALNKLLSDYGQPTDVQIYVGDSIFEEFSTEGRFSILFFWEDKGILMVKDGQIEKTKPLSICMKNLYENSSAFWLWNPSKKRTIEEVGGDLLFGPSHNQRKFYSLEESININTEAFYKTYIKSENKNLCFEISDTLNYLK